MILIDRLIDRIIELKAPIVVGLDPIMEMIPDVYKKTEDKAAFLSPGSVIFDFNADVIDVIADYVPAVKPQIAYYEAYGIDGLIAFQKTVDHAKKKGLIVIEDGKRNDIGSTSRAYANGHIGRSITTDGRSEIPLFDVDCITVNPYLGSDGIEPFIDVCDLYDKGIFVLVKTSNRSSGEFQDKVFADGSTLYEAVADHVARAAEGRIGKYQYSSIGAVVGATYPVQSIDLRKRMKNSYFLVPGYGKQGGGAEDVLPCFDGKGLGAIVNSSRGILYAYENDHDIHSISREQFRSSVLRAVKEMQADILNCLHEHYPDMLY